jgi:ParB-like chromosome segregation protein Spo0J
MIEAYNINDITPNPSNPRVIRDGKFEALVKSIREFPDMAMVRPLIINQENIILGGNQRYMAMKELGFPTSTLPKSRLERRTPTRIFNQRQHKFWGMELG